MTGGDDDLAALGSKVPPSHQQYCNCLHTYRNCSHAYSSCSHTCSSCSHTCSNCSHTCSNCSHTYSNCPHTYSNCSHTCSNCAYVCFWCPKLIGPHSQKKSESTNLTDQNPGLEQTEPELLQFRLLPFETSFHHIKKCSISQLF